MRRVLEFLVLIVSLAVGVLSALSLYLNIRKSTQVQTPPAIEQEEDAGDTAQEGET